MYTNPQGRICLARKFYEDLRLDVAEAYRRLVQDPHQVVNYMFWFMTHHYQVHFFSYGTAPLLIVSILRDLYANRILNSLGGST